MHLRITYLLTDANKYTRSCMSARRCRCSATGHIFLDVPTRGVSYCQDDRKGNCIFAFIAKESPEKPKRCYGFKSDNQAQEVMAAIGHAFAKAGSAAPTASTGQQPLSFSGGGWLPPQSVGPGFGARGPPQQQQYPGNHQQMAPQPRSPASIRMQDRLRLGSEAKTMDIEAITPDG